MDPIKFEQSTHFLPATRINQVNGKVENFSYHFYREPSGKFVITCIETTEEDLRRLTADKKFWLVLPFAQCPPFTIQITSPFTPRVLGLNGKPINYETKTKDDKKDEDRKGPSDDK